jgi:1-acyl-sn-glycerol-3-phosphate acyltransferase
MNKILNEKLAYTKLPIDNLKDEWKPFTRFDRNNWRELEIYLGAIFLLPIRFALTTLAVMTLATVCYLLRYDSAAKANTEFPYYKRLAVRITARLSARTILLFSGFYWISTKRRKISEFDSSYPEARYANRPRDTATIIVSNHVGWTDIMAILGVWNQAPSFLSKAEVINYPFFGRAAIGLQSIFVDRNSEKARIEVLEQIL